MKLLCVLIINFAISGFIFPQQILFKVGDNIKDYISKNQPKYLTQGSFFLDSPDGRMDFLKYKAETDDSDTKFMVRGSTVFGVMQYDNNSTSILYDITGDGILDIGVNSLFMPFWVLSESEFTNISKNNNLQQLLNNGLAMFNNDDSPYSNGGMNNYLSGYFPNIGTDTDNRDLFYGMLEYYNFSQNPSLALLIITELGIRYNERFGTLHPLILLHTAESLMNLGYYDYARQYINSILSVNADFIPAMVYSWQLETDPAIKEKKYNELKTDHPNHWIVKQI